jgi:hypothetical protein
MYTILLNETNELITSVKERIMQRSKLVDNLHFLVDPIYKGHDMSEFMATMEYLLPVSKELHTEQLTLSDELYKEKLEYKLPFDTTLTKEAGKIEVQLTFTKIEMDEEGKTTQYVRKTSPASITIVPISAWSDIVADSALDIIDQRIIQTEAMINALNDLSQEIYDNKADNIVFNTNKIQLVANGKPIGDPVSLDETHDQLIDDSADGNIKVVEF